MVITTALIMFYITFPAVAHGGRLPKLIQHERGHREDKQKIYADIAGGGSNLIN